MMQKRAGGGARRLAEAAALEEDASLLSEMLREAERLADAQDEAIERLDRKIERMLMLGVASLGGGAAIGALLAERAPGSGAAAGGLAAATLLTFAALASFTSAYVGLWKAPASEVVPRPDWLTKVSADSAWGPIRHYRALIAGHCGAITANQALMDGMIRRRRWGVWLLLAGALCYSATAFLQFSA